MKKLKLLLLVLVSTLTVYSQSLYLPTNPDSLLVPVNLNNTVRKVYAIDLVRFSTFLSNYYNKTQSDARYLQSFTETDPLSILKSGTTNLTGGITINGTASAFPVLFATTRVQHTTGANVAAANNLTLGNDGNTFSITGNTQINSITNTNWQSGASVNLLFTGTPTLKHNTAGGAGTSVLDLAGDADWTAAPGDIVSLVYVGSKWVETTRKIAGVNGSRGSVTNVSVVSTNGFAGTVSNSQTTPAISMKTTVTGILKGNGTTGVVSAAVSGTDLKTINGNSIIGSGDLSITTGGSQNLQQVTDIGKITTAHILTSGISATGPGQDSAIIKATQNFSASTYGAFTQLVPTSTQLGSNGMPWMTTFRRAINVNPTPRNGDPDNYIWDMGTNMVSSGAIADPNRPAWRMQFEANYQTLADDSTMVGEQHLIFHTPTFRGVSGQDYRLSSWGINHQANAAYMYLTGTKFWHQDMGGHQYQLLTADGAETLSGDAPALQFTGMSNGTKTFLRFNGVDVLQGTKTSSGISSFGIAPTTDTIYTGANYVSLNQGSGVRRVTLAMQAGTLYIQPALNLGNDAGIRWSTPNADGSMPADGQQSFILDKVISQGSATGTQSMKVRVNGVDNFFAVVQSVGDNGGTSLRLTVNNTANRPTANLGANIHYNSDSSRVEIRRPDGTFRGLAWSGESGSGGGTSYTFQHSLSNSSGTVNLVGDAATPGNSKYYGTNGSGTKGFYDLPSSSGMAIAGSITSATAKSVLFVGASSDLQQDNTYFNYDNVNKRLVIGSHEFAGGNSTSMYFYNQGGTFTTRSGSNNTFMGYATSGGITSGSGNTTMGAYAGGNLSTGAENTFMGDNAGANVSTGNYNTFLGNRAGAGVTGSYNTIIGSVNVANVPSSLNYSIHIVAADGYAGNTGVNIPTARHVFIGGGSNSSVALQTYYFGQSPLTAEAASVPINFNAPSGLGTNIGGASFTINAGRGTGSATGGDLLFGTSNTTTTGTTLHSLSTRLTIKANTGYVILNNVPTFADDTAAGTGGLTTGTIFKTSTGQLMIKL